jgi:hypothetical protein
MSPKDTVQGTGHSAFDRRKVEFANIKRDGAGGYFVDVRFVSGSKQSFGPYDSYEHAGKLLGVIANYPRDKDLVEPEGEQK